MLICFMMLLLLLSYLCYRIKSRITIIINTTKIIFDCFIDKQEMYNCQK